MPRTRGTEERAKGAHREVFGGMKRRINIAAGILHRPKGCSWTSRPSHRSAESQPYPGNGEDLMRPG